MEPIKEESESPHNSPTSRVPMATTHSEDTEPSESENTTSLNQSEESQEVSNSRSEKSDLISDNINVKADDKFKDLDDET